MLRRLKKYGIGAGGMLVLVMAILLATGWGSAVAAQITSVFVTNDAAHPVPVHEQGTANVSVTNTALSVRDQETTQLIASATVTPTSSSLNVDVSGYKEIRITTGASSCNGGHANFGIVATEGGTPYFLQSTDDLCQHILSTVLDVPGRTISIGCNSFGFCDGDFSIPIVVFGRSN